MAKTKKTETKTEPKPKGLGAVALVIRVPKEAISYIDREAGDRARTAYLRDVLAKGDAGLGKILTK